MLRSFSLRAWRWAAVPVAPKSRSKTAHGLISMGSGVDGVLQEMVFKYAQLKPGEQPPT